MRRRSLTQFAFFMAYFVVSLPAAALIARLGNSKSIMFALGVMVVGCLIVPLATHFDTYWLVLVALFVIASGITILQVVANPLAAALGPPERSHFRLTFSQTFNSFGTWLGAATRLRHDPRGRHLRRAHTARRSRRSCVPNRSAASTLVFLAIAGALVLLALFIFAFRRLLDVTKPVDEGQRPSIGHCAQVALGAVRRRRDLPVRRCRSVDRQRPDQLPARARHAEHPAGGAGKMVSFYWGGAMVGRLIGSGLLFVVKQRAPWLLAVVRARRRHCCALPSSQLHGSTAAYLALSIGLFNSIMFPVDLHDDAGAFDRGAGGHLGPAVPGDRRWRHPAVRRTG